MMIVIDYDAGNTANVLRALKSIGVRSSIVCKSRENSEGPWTNIALE